MTRFHAQARGEGKIGCVLALLVFLLAGAVGAKVFPVLYNNNELSEAAAEMAARASILPAATLTVQLRQKAKELAIPEALAPGAMRVEINGDGTSGTCTITLKYSQKVDLYGAYTLVMDTDKTIRKPFMDLR